MAETKLKARFSTGKTNPSFVADVQRFRARFFVGTLGWDLSVVDGREIDQFDRADTIHCGLIRDGEIVGCFRAIRTDRPYLGQTIFPDIADAQPYPSRPDMWEISRFGVHCPSAHFTVARTLYGLVFLFGFAVEATSLVALSDLNHERFVRMLGIQTRRLGRPKVIGADNYGRPIEVLSGEIPMGEQSGPSFQKLLDIAQQAEIEDETLVFGRLRISA